MRLDACTWGEVEDYLVRSNGILLPTGSTEQHGPMGLIGTDAICAEKIAEGAAEVAQALVAPTLAYTPAPFNMAFPGTVSLTAETFRTMAEEILTGLASHGFRHLYVLNGHGANIAPLREAANVVQGAEVRIRSWWDFPAVNALRAEYYGDWEGMHATPSEVAITQHTHRVVPPGDAATPPKELSRDYMAAHAGDRHGPPEDHRRDFPDGRVGSHSALATPEQGKALLQTAIASVAEDFEQWTRGEA